MWPEYCTSPSKDAVAGMSGRQRHEYKKHGTCTRLSPKGYVEQVQSSRPTPYPRPRPCLNAPHTCRRPYVDVKEVEWRLGAEHHTRVLRLRQEAHLVNAAPLQSARQYLLQNSKGSVETATLIRTLGGPNLAAIKVDRKCQLTEMTTCWAKGPGDRVASQVECPPALLASERNTAVQYGCVRVLLGEAGACMRVTDQMLKFLKGRIEQLPPTVPQPQTVLDR